MGQKPRHVFLAVLPLVVLTSPARGGMDAPGIVSFQWLADEEVVHRRYPDIPEDERRYEARAFFSSDASAFGDEGVFIWAGFHLESPDGSRYGQLLIDLHLARVPRDDETPMPHEAIRAEYLETWDDQVLFAGEVVIGDVWIVDMLLHESDGGAVEGDFAMVFGGMDSAYPGSRVFLRGRFATSPSPASLRKGHRIPYDDSNDYVYVDTGCSGDVYIADDSGEGCDCGGDDPDAGGGCEGDSSDGGGGCEGDSGGSCEGDSGGGCEGGGGGGCEGGGGGACSGGDSCSHTGARISRPGRNGGPLRTVLRFFPELSALLFLVVMKRKYR